MKAITRKDDNFRPQFNYICEVIPAMRAIYMQVYKIERHPQGILFFDKAGTKLSAISHATFDKEEQEFKAAWNVKEK